jgi:DNA-binding CsgD family transcriptional regulator
MPVRSLGEYLLSHIDNIVEQMCQRLALLPRSPDREYQIQTEKDRKRLCRWMEELIGGLGGRQDFFLIDQQRAIELPSLQSLGLEFSFHYYNIFQHVLKEHLVKICEEEKPDPLTLCLELQDLNNILLQGYNCIATYYVKTREDRIEKILRMREIQDFQTHMLQEPLSKREMEVLKCIADGHSDQAIADALFISKNTIRSHIKNIYRKLAVTSKAQAISKAFYYKILDK